MNHNKPRQNRLTWPLQHKGATNQLHEDSIGRPATSPDLTTRGMGEASRLDERDLESASPALLNRQDPQPMNTEPDPEPLVEAPFWNPSHPVAGDATAGSPSDTAGQASNATPRNLEPGAMLAEGTPLHRTAASLEAMVCHALAPEATLNLATEQTTLSATPILDLSLTFQLSSRPNASKVIYLDFNGHTTTGTAWNDATMGSSFYSPAYSFDGDRSVFSDAELTRIQQIWQQVANDYSPFDVNVTTLEPPTDWLAKSSETDPNYGIRVVITSYGPYSNSSGGIALRKLWATGV